MRTKVRNSFLQLFPVLLLLAMTSCHAKNKGEKVTLTVAVKDSFATTGQRNDAVQRAMNILTKRVHAITGSDAAISYDTTAGNISVVFYDTANIARVEHSIETKGNLQIMETYKYADVLPMVRRANDSVAAHIYYDVPDTIPKTKEQAIVERMERKFPLLRKLLIPADKDGAISDRAYIGHVKPEDTATVTAWLSEASIRSLFPADAHFIYGIDDMDIRPAVYLVKAPAAGQGISAIASAGITYSSYSRHPVISIELQHTDAEKWRAITGRNVGNYLAIIVDGIVWYCPKIETEVGGGHIELPARNYTDNMAQDLANILQFGSLPLSLHVISCKKGN